MELTVNVELTLIVMFYKIYLDSEKIDVNNI